MENIRILELTKEEIQANNLVLEATQLKNIGLVNEAIFRLQNAIYIYKKINNLTHYEVALKMVSYLDSPYDVVKKTLYDLLGNAYVEKLDVTRKGILLKIYDRLRITSKKHNKEDMYLAATMCVIIQGYLAYESDLEKKKGKKEFPHYKKYPDLEFKLTQKQKDDYKGFYQLVLLCKDIFRSMTLFNRVEIENRVKTCIVNNKF